MRVLLFGDATDDPAHAAPAGTGFRAIQEALAAQAAEPVDARFAFAFPLPTLATYVRRRLESFDPDIVLFHCAGYPVASVMLGARMARMFGGRAYPVLSSMRKVAHLVFAINTMDTPQSRWHAEGSRQLLYEKFRDALVSRGLGQAMIDVDTAAASIDAALRVLAMSENLVVVTRGPLWNGQFMLGKPRLSQLYRMGVERVELLDRAVAETCADLRLPYRPMVGATVETLSAEGQLRDAEDELQTLLPLLA